MPAMIRALVALLWLFVALPAAACTWQPPLDLAGAAMADAVFEGRLIDFQAFSPPGNPHSVTHAIATFEVTDILRGSVPPVVTVLFLDNLTGAPDRWRWDRTVIVATVPAGAGDGTAAMGPNPRPDLPVVLHPACGTPFVAPATAQSRAAIGAAIKAAMPRSGPD